MDLEKQTKKIMLEAIKRYAKENDVSSERVQLLIYTDNSELEPKYKVMVDNKELKKVSFNDILNVNVLVYPKEKELNLYFFVGTKPNKPIDLKYVFNELN